MGTLGLIVSKQGTLTQKHVFMVKINETSVFEALFLATWAEAQFWKQ